MKGLARWLGSRVRLRRSEPLRVLPASEAYRLWAPSYGRPANRFQEIEGEALRALLPRLEGRRVLDLGCGRGRIAALARERGARTTVGLDATLAMLATRPRESFARVAGEAVHLPFREASFDVAIAGLVLGHVADLAASLAEISRVVRTALLISDFHPDATVRGWQRTFLDPRTGREAAIEHHGHRLADYSDLLERLGWTLEAVKEPLWRGLPVAFVLRARRRSGA